jgi:hypothetical protein
MLEKLDFMVRFWGLKARHEAGAALTGLELGELFSLLSLMVVDDPMPEPSAAPREEGMAVQIAVKSGFLAAELHHVCSAGLVVTTAAPFFVGQSTVVRIADPGRDVEYTLPCVVEWTFAGLPITMALRVDGAPTRMRCTDAEQGTWGAPLGWSDPVGVLAE